MAYRLHNEAQNRTVGLCVRLSWAVHMACANGHSARWNVERLAEDFAPETTLEQIAERLVCKVCGARDGQMTIFQDIGATAARHIDEFNRSGKYER